MKPRRNRRHRRAVVLVVAGLTVLAGVAVVAFSMRGSQPAQPHRGLTAGEFPEPGVLHVHGLGVDPRDGTLYAATHTGLFRIPTTGTAQRVANRYQDTMGFTVIGPETFLGSGHPDLREDIPVRLGLIESRDGGETWSPLSLEGKADFHALQAAHGAVYGYDSTSGSFMVSHDRRTWDTRSQLPLRDFVVSPTAADTVVATTEQGLMRSADGGRSWQRLTAAPSLVVLAWQQARQLYGVTPDGKVQMSSDGGLSWTARGRVGGEPEAMTVEAHPGEESLYIAVAGRGILASTNGGRTFTTRYSD